MWGLPTRYCQATSNAVKLALFSTQVIIFFTYAARANADETSPPVNRKLTLVYAAEFIGPRGAPADLFLPLAKTDEHQRVLSRRVEATVSGGEGKESRFGNEFWHAHVPALPPVPVRVQVTYEIERQTFGRSQLFANAGTSYSVEEQRSLSSYLQPDRLVPVAAEFLDKVRADIPKTDPAPLARARAIYDFVVDNMEYKKIGTGWGNGDTFWACSQRYGNCTDFHSLFISLARAEKIPSRFEIGFSLPETHSGVIAGYHCWAEFYLPKIGWVPIDASEAKKAPEKRDLFFGTHPADRVQFTVGRDLVLGEGHRGAPLNYFIFPYAEVNGTPAPKEMWKTTISFNDQ